MQRTEMVNEKCFTQTSKKQQRGNSATYWALWG